jgi:DNA replication protein DnaC
MQTAQQIFSIQGLVTDYAEIKTPTNDELDARSMALLIAARKADAEKRWLASCPVALQASDWSHPHLSPYREQITRVMAYKRQAKGILASGPTGRGKSRALWQLMRRLGCEEGCDVRYWHAADWFAQLQQQINYGRDDARGWVESVAVRGVVFLDDLGQECVQRSREDWAQGWFFRFLDLRVGHGLPLFITTNLTADEMAERSGNVRGDPLIRRLLDLCEVVKF